MTEVNRFIRIYEKDGERHIDDILLHNVNLKDLQLLIGPEIYKDDNLLYNCYFLDKEALDKLTTLHKENYKIDLRNQEFYLEAEEKTKTK